MKPTNHKGVSYYPNLAEAKTVLSAVSQRYGLTEARIVEYTKGYAIQKYKSGPYFNALTGEFN